MSEQTKPAVVMYLYDDLINVTLDGQTWGSQRIEPNAISIGMFIKDLLRFGIDEYTIKDERSKPAK